jgi:hypothetical protein
MTAGDVLPDYIEPIVGWRAWAVVPGPLLASPVMRRTVWQPRERFEAVCAARHEVPHPECRCGIYAAASREQLADLRYPEYNLAVSDVVVVGEIKLWGGVIPGEQGWRAQFAYPRRLLIPYECWRLAKPLSARYGVPTSISNTYRLKEA